MSLLRKSLKRGFAPPTPKLAIKIGALVLFRTDAQLALTGRRAIPTKLENAGFRFKYLTLSGALKELLD